MSDPKQYADPGILEKPISILKERIIDGGGEHEKAFGTTSNPSNPVMDALNKVILPSNQVRAPGERSNKVPMEQVADLGKTPSKAVRRTIPKSNPEVAKETTNL